MDPRPPERVQRPPLAQEHVSAPSPRRGLPDTTPAHHLQPSTTSAPSTRFNPASWLEASRRVALNPKPGSADGVAYQWRLWLDYCAEVSHDPFTPAAVDSLEVDTAHPGRLHEFLGYILHRRPGLQPATAAQYVSTVSRRLSMYGIQLRRSPMLQQTIVRLRQQPREHTPARQPATVALMRRATSDPGISPGVRCALLIAWDALLRSREYCSHTASTFDPRFTMLRRHATFHSSSLELFVPHSKSDPWNAGASIFLYANADTAFCPVSALRRYIASTPTFLPDQPLFRHNDGSYVVRDDISAALKRHALAVSIPQHLVSSHSIRIGAAFTLMDRGVDWNTIKVRGRWKTDSVALSYGRMSDSRARAASQALSLSLPSNSRPLFSSYTS
jgi:hypothetical protein